MEEEERLQLSITGFRECSKKERVVLATSVETLGVDLRTRTKQLGSEVEGGEEGSAM